jgi:hypothetical protein
LSITNSEFFVFNSEIQHSYSLHFPNNLSFSVLTSRH